ncbi:MAG TPA: hypothetical protein VFX47_06755 [Gammaproteobacteria bacterium]|nr:hypothetical protein [Gammaproteobacteria bacterium]
MENVNPTETSPAPRKSRRWLLLAMFLLFAAPLIAAWVLYLNINHWHFGTTNHGEFIKPPRQLVLTALPLPIAGGSLAPDYFKGRWTLVYIGSSVCSADCEGALYNTRQVRYAMGEKIESVQRLYLVDGTPANPDKLTRLHPDLTVADIASREGQMLADRFSDNGAAPPDMGRYIYLVDPRGFYVLRYATHADPEGLLKDMKHLLGGGGGM